MLIFLQMALKRPDSISFSKKNVIHPFDGGEGSSSTSAETTQSLEFWSNKNDASLFLIGQHTKKRPNGMTFVRMFDGKVLDMIEVGVTGYVGMAKFKVYIQINEFIVKSHLTPYRPGSLHQATNHYFISRPIYSTYIHDSSS
jgi:hypothetical protein